MGDIMYPEIKLDYTFKDLEPYLSEETLTYHYNLYKNNLHKLNSLLQKENYQFKYPLKNLIENISIFPLSSRGDILYYILSIMNHNLYFNNLSNKKNTTPSGKLAKDIEKYFGNFNNFKTDFIRHAMNLSGSGYTFLVKDKNNRLMIINTSNEDNPYEYGFTPIIALDLWEHAYYTQYPNNKEEYINNFFKILDFNKINEYYEKI